MITRPKTRKAEEVRKVVVSGDPFAQVGTKGTQSIRLGRIYPSDMGRNWKLKVNYLVTSIIPCKLSRVYSVIGFRDIHM